MSAADLTPPSDRSEAYVPQSLADLKAAARRRGDWLWHGYLAPGSLTLLTSLWKAGKSTLIAVLLARMKTGGTVAGLPVATGRAVVVSEEPPEKWVERSLRVDLDGHIDWFCLPFAGRPTEAAWLEFLARLERLHEEKPTALVVIDSLANLSPMRSENDAVQMLRPLQPLRRLTERGVAVLITHHPKKGPTQPGQAARGSGALAAFVDVIVEMHALSRRTNDRRRLLRSFSRHSATPARLVIEWTADGTDYRGLGTSAEPTYEHGWPVLHAILEESEGPLTRRTILHRWPETAPRPAKMTLWKWLGQAVQQGRVLQNGQGTRRDPFRYQLPGMAEKWTQNFLASFMKRLDQDARGAGIEGPELPRAGDEHGATAVPTARPEEAMQVSDPALPAERVPQTAVSVSPPPDFPPEQTPAPAEPPPPGTPVRLRWPWNMANPADVPQEEWQRARAAQGNI